MIAFVLTVAALLIVERALTHRADWSRRQWGIATLLFAGAVCGALVSLPNLLFVGKVLGRLAMPVGVLWGALLLAPIYAWHRRNRRGAAGLAALFLVYTLAGNPSLGGAMLAWLEHDYVTLDPTEGEPLDAIFLLGGATSMPPAPGREAALAPAGDRLLTAARVFTERDVGVLVVSGSTIEGLGPPRDIAAESVAVLEDMGVPPDKVERLTGPKNSSQEVQAYQALAAERGWTRVGVVTSAWHLRRVMKLCDEHGLAAEPMPADRRGFVGWSGLLSVIPDGSGFANIQKASWEVVGAAVGR